MDNEEISRRIFLINSCSAVSIAWLAARWPEVLAAQQHAHEAAKSEQQVKFEFFTAEQALEIEAVAACIIPTDSTPGAREARVIYFIDRALASFDKDKQPLYQKGLAALQARAKNRFSDLDSAQQIKLLKGIQHTQFFQQVRAHTIMGFLANPEYGGNYEQTGWKHIGFEDRHYFKPPFGFYDK
ncbi:MAG: gluconate 2-dehydrogenase subunit 3 family protein [Blastocatellia bacterium]